MELELSTAITGDMTWVKVSPVMSVPDHAKVTCDDCNGYAVAVDVALQGDRYAAREIVIRQLPGGPPVTAEAIRSVPIKPFVQQVHLLVTSSLGQGAPEAQSLAPWEGWTSELVERLREDGPTTEALEWVAFWYRLAVLFGQPPTQRVETRFGLPRSTAGRWVALARKQGLLGAAEVGKAGEVGTGRGVR